MNIAMYPGYQFRFWLRSIFIPGSDFEYVDVKKQKRSLSVGGWKNVRDAVLAVGVVGVVVGGLVVRAGGIEDAERFVRGGFRCVVKQGRGMLRR
jgi:hypothetical protein